MRNLTQIKVGDQFVAMGIFILVAVWHLILWHATRTGEHTDVVLQALYYVLPWATILLPLLLLASRISRRQSFGRWLVAALLAGVSPWITFGIYVWISA
jgi:hypothetical protein